MGFEVIPWEQSTRIFSLLLETMSINNAFKSTRSDSRGHYIIAVLNFMIENQLF